MVKTYPIRGPTKVCGKKKRKKWVLVTISTVIFYALGVRQIGTRFATLRDQNLVCLFISRQQNFCRTLEIPRNGLDHIPGTPIRTRNLKKHPKTYSGSFVQVHAHLVGVPTFGDIWVFSWCGLGELSGSVRSRARGISTWFQKFIIHAPYDISIMNQMSMTRNTARLMIFDSFAVHCTGTWVTVGV